MKTLTIAYLLALLFLGETIIICAILSWYRKWQNKARKQQDQYEKLYERIQRDIRDLEPYRDVKLLFDRLCDLKWKNPEKTKVLYEEMMKRYSKEANTERVQYIKKSLMKHIEKPVNVQR